MENHTTPNQVDSLFELTEACPSEMELAAYIEGTLSFTERHLLERHLMTCFRCSEIAASYQRERNQEMKEAIPELLKKSQWEFGGGIIHFGDFVQDLLEKHPIAGKNIEQWFVDIQMPDETGFKENLKEEED